MRKKKIYLDTSVISYLEAYDTPDKMEDTLKLWKILKQDSYDIYISETVFYEINKCNEPKRTFLFKKLEEIDYHELMFNSETYDLTEEYLNNEVLSNNSIDDLIHIAFAITNDIDYILSWNFKHFVNINTINKVNLLNIELGYNEVLILPPSMFVGGENNERK